MPNGEFHIPYVPDSETKGPKFVEVVSPLINAIEADAQSFEIAGDSEGAQDVRDRAQGMRDFLTRPTPEGVLYGKELLRLIERAQEDGTRWKPEYEIVRSYLADALKLTGWRVAS